MSEQSESIYISGKLLKKSNNKYNLKMQERFVKIQGYSLYYYKKENDDKELGVITLDSVDFVRLYDRSNDCKKFELMSEDRLYSFAAESSQEAKRWVDTINSIMNNLKEYQIKAERNKIIEGTPRRVRLFDSEGIESFYNEIKKDLDSIYPSDLSTIYYDDEITLHKHLEYARFVQKYLEDFLPELKYQKNQRYDILAIFLVAINEFIGSRLLPLLQDDSDIINNTNLGDLHTLIDWITKFQLLIKRCYCPLLPNSPSNEWLTEHANLTNRPTSPNYCDISEIIPELCNRYVNGNKSKGIDGAASHLFEHCEKVWKSLIQNPNEMLQRHLDGSFYTNSPTDMWEALNQHISLATSTQSPILHVMIADKVKDAMNHITEIISEYVESLDTSLDNNLKEIELEYFCALANDNALNIEEVFAVIDNFELDDIRSKIIDIFDSVTINLVKCGQLCLNRIASLVLSDINDSLKQIFTNDWLEGAQVQVITATLTDYMGDLETYLMPFWNEKFVYILLEQVILNYTRVVLLSQHEIDNRGVYYKKTLIQATGMVNAIKGFGNMINSKIKSNNNNNSYNINNKVGSCIVDPESLGRLAQDVNTLNAFFCQRAGQETATEFLGIINEVSLLLFSDPEDLVFHVLNRIAVYPSSAQAIHDILFLCMSLRNDITLKEIQTLKDALEPALTTAPRAAQENVKNNIAEGRLGLLYTDLNNMISSAIGQKVNRFNSIPSLARKLKDMANIPLAALKRAINEIDDDENDTEELTVSTSPKSPSLDLINRRKSNFFKTNEGLVEDILEVIQKDENEISNLLTIKETERQINEQREAELKKLGVGIITIEGHLDKKSPAHNLWQSRWFKLTTRIVENTNDNDDESDQNIISKTYVYTLMWYKKKGGAVVKSLDSMQIQSIQVLMSNRELVYDISNSRLILASEVKPDVETVPVVVFDSVCAITGVHQSNVRQSAFSFCLITNDKKEIILKTVKVDKMITWINALSAVSKLTYDTKSSQWIRDGIPEVRYDTEKSDMSSNPFDIEPSYNSSLESLEGHIIIPSPNSSFDGTLPKLGLSFRGSNSPTEVSYLNDYRSSPIDKSINSTNSNMSPLFSNNSLTNNFQGNSSPTVQSSNEAIIGISPGFFNDTKLSPDIRKDRLSAVKTTSNIDSSAPLANTDMKQPTRNSGVMTKRTSALATLFGTFPSNEEALSNESNNVDEGSNSSDSINKERDEDNGKSSEYDEITAEEEKLKAEELLIQKRKEELRLKKLQQQRSLEVTLPGSTPRIPSTPSPSKSDLSNEAAPPVKPVQSVRRSSILDFLKPKPVPEPERESAMTFTSVYNDLPINTNRRSSLKNVTDDGSIQIVNPLKSSVDLKVTTNPLIESNNNIIKSDTKPVAIDKRISTPRQVSRNSTDNNRNVSLESPNNKSLFKNTRFIAPNSNEESKSPQSSVGLTDEDVNSNSLKLKRSVSEDYNNNDNNVSYTPLIRSVSLDEDPPVRSMKLSLINPQELKSTDTINKSWKSQYSSDKLDNNNSNNNITSAKGISSNNAIFDNKINNKLNKTNISTSRKVSFADESQDSNTLVSINEYDPKANTLGNIVEGRESDISRESTNTSNDSSDDKISITPINMKPNRITTFELGRDSTSNNINKKLLNPNNNSNNNKTNGCGCCIIT